MKKLVRNRRGLSPVVSTVILTSTILAMVLSTSYLANDLLINQMENAEFDVAKDVMDALNNMVKEVLYKPYSSRYVKTGFRTTMPNLHNTAETITVWVKEGAESPNDLITDNPISIITIKGGTSVTDLSMDMIGTSSVLLNDFTSLGHLFIQRSDQVELILDFSRIRCIYSGSLNVSQEYNIIEAVFINMTTGSIQLNDRSVIMVRNLGTTISQHLYQGTLTIGINDTRGNDDTILYSDLPHETTLINLMVIDIEISIVGGV